MRIVSSPTICMEFQLPPSHEGERSAPLSASSRKNFNSRPFQGGTSQPVRTARPSAQPHRIRAGPLRGKLRGPADCPCTNRPYCTRAGPFQGKFHRHVRRPARQSNPISPAQGCSGKNFISPKTPAQQTAPRPHPIRRHNARRPSNHSGQTSRPGRRRSDHSSARPPRPNFLRTKAPARRSPVPIGTPLTPRPATAQRCPARRWRP